MKNDAGIRGRDGGEKMLSPAQALRKGYGKIKREWKVGFLTAFLLGLVVHMPVMLSDIPNHDGLASMYFDQNMITSGRWFLMVACGASSFFTVPWVIGLLGLLFLGVAAVCLCELFEIGKTWAVIAVSGLLAVFPALASTFAYVFTLDGYMLALLLSVASVLFTKKRRLGFLPGAVCLAFSLGTYQGYLALAMILSVFSVLALFCGERGTGEKASFPRWKALRCLKEALRYLYMGALGAVLYYVILHVLLKIQGKELDTYQGINGMAGEGAGGLLSSLRAMYADFVSFTFKGNVLFQNGFALAACLLLAAAAAASCICMARRRKWWKNPVKFVIIIVALLALPPVTNVILLISPDVTYHLLMRYQWVLYLIGAVALAEKCGGSTPEVLAEWAAFTGAFVLIFCYGLEDNIAYANLQRRYEKTYAYCLRLLDRIEQTDGYYPGIPIAMVGVVGDVQFPVTDITLPVTGGMIGLNGDVLLYTGENYQAFIRNYLGATLNILPAEAMAEKYFSEEYVAMDSFPGENSVRIIDGILYVKTENINH